MRRVTAMPDPHEAAIDPRANKPGTEGRCYADASPLRKRVASALRGFGKETDDPIGQLKFADKAIAAYDAALGGDDDSSQLVANIMERTIKTADARLDELQVPVYAAPDVPHTLAERIDLLVERMTPASPPAAAMKRAAEIQTTHRAALDEYCDKFVDAWGGYYKLPKDWRSSLESWYGIGAELGLLYDCMDIAFAAKGVEWRWKYFCGVVWRRLEERQQIASELVDEDPSA